MSTVLIKLRICTYFPSMDYLKQQRCQDVRVNVHTVQQALHEVTYNLNMVDSKRITALGVRSPLAIHFCAWTDGRFG